MIRLMTVAGFALLVAPSAQSMTLAPIPQPDGMITQVAFGCGPGMTRVNGVCMARSAIRQARRAYYGTGAYYGAGYGGYYGAYAPYVYPALADRSYGAHGSYANRSYVTGRPTVFPRYYGSYAAAYPASSYGGYANYSYVTGRPTLLPRYYNAGWASR